MEIETTNELLKQLLAAVKQLLAAVKENTAAVKENTEEVKGLRGELGNDPLRYQRAMKVEVAAEYLGVSTDQLYDWVKEGKIGSCRLTNSQRPPIRILKKDADAFLASTRIPTVQECRDDLDMVV